MTGREIANNIRDMISPRMVKKLENELFRTRCDIQPAISKLEQDCAELRAQIASNERAIRFLKQFKS